MKNDKLIKGLGIGATIIGIAATLIGNWVNDKTLDRKINDQVTKAIATKSTVK